MNRQNFTPNAEQVRQNELGATVWIGDQEFDIHYGGLGYWYGEKLLAQVNLVDHNPTIGYFTW